MYFGKRGQIPVEFRKQIGIFSDVYRCRRIASPAYQAGDTADQAMRILKLN